MNQLDSEPVAPGLRSRGRALDVETTSAPTRSRLRTGSKLIGTLALTIVLMSPAAMGSTQDVDQAPPEPSESETGSSTEEAKTDTLEELRRAVEAQQATIESQSLLIGDQQEQIEAQQKKLEEQSRLLRELVTRIDQMNFTAGTVEDEPRDGAEVAAREQLSEAEAADSIGESQSTGMDTVSDQFPGSISVPGTNAAFRIGGFANLTFVENLEPLKVDDRFVPAAIPIGVAEPGTEGRVVVTSRRSRLNLDSRLDSSLGEFRAFVEGDFKGEDVEGNGSFFRLRHAFGQYGNWLLGQTNSTLMDPYTSPEEIDLEGISGQIFTRQALLRYRTRLGTKRGYEAFFGLEDPQPDVTGGVGLSEIPDLMFRIGRRNDETRSSSNLGVVVRQLRAEPDDGEDVERTIGWAVSWGQRIPLESLGVRDNIQLQVSAGEGFGRYVRDLNFEGGHDAIIDPETGELRPFPVFAGYGSFQHWWPWEWRGFHRLRSTFTISWVYVDNFDFEPAEAYSNTQRVSANILWSPLTTIDIGVEYLWGRRENFDEKSNTSSQLQVSTFFRF